MVTPPTLAKRWGVKPDKVLGWIRSGELKAMDFSSSPNCGRPRFRIEEAEITAFKQRRTIQPLEKPRPRQRRQANPSIKNFF